MKKIILLLTFFIQCNNLIANNIEENYESKNENLHKEVQSIYKENIKLELYNNNFSDFLDQASQCAQVQLDVLNSFYGNPLIPEQYVINMALGAYIGCMRATAR